MLKIRGGESSRNFGLQSVAGMLKVSQTMMNASSELGFRV